MIVNDILLFNDGLENIRIYSLFIPQKETPEGNAFLINVLLYRKANDYTEKKNVDFYKLFDFSKVMTV